MDFLWLGRRVLLEAFSIGRMNSSDKIFSGRNRSPLGLSRIPEPGFRITEPGVRTVHVTVVVPQGDGTGTVSVLHGTGLGRSQFSRALSTAFSTSIMGSLGSKRSRMVPSRAIRNLVKFHLIPGWEA